MAVRKVAVTLPEELFDMVERLRSIEHRSRSDVFQDALRRYFGEPTYEPTEEERRLLDEALAGYADVRRAVVRGFPFVVFYRLAHDRIDVLRIVPAVRPNADQPPEDGR